MFSCEFCEISKNNFSYRTPPVAASVQEKRSLKVSQGINNWGKKTVDPKSLVN